MPRRYFVKPLLRCFLLLLFGVSGACVDAQRGNPVVGSNTNTLRNPVSYGKPNQSRIWYNSAQNRWDALIPKNDEANKNGNGVSASDHFIMKDVAGSQTFTDVELEDRDAARPDAFWDDTNNQLYVFSSHATRAEFWRMHYDPATDTYGFRIGKPGTGVPVSGITHPNNDFGANTPASLYVTSNGDVWVAVMKDGGLQVQHSRDGGATWLTKPITLDESAKLGVTTWIDFANQGDTFVGVFAGENGKESVNTNYSFRYINQDADPSVLANWIDDSPPQSVGIEQSDDHVSAARDSAGNQYFAVKTESGASPDPLIKLYKRTPAGVWSQFEVTKTQEVPEQSRPSIVIDEDNAEISVYVNGAEIVSKWVRKAGRFRARLDSLEDINSAPFVTLFSKRFTIFTDLITPRQPVNTASGIVVLAHNRTEASVWVSKEDIAAETVTAIDVSLDQGTLDPAGGTPP